MKRKLKIMANLLLTAAFAAVSASCSKDEPESPQAIEVQDNESLTQVMFADETQGKSGVTFTTTGAWTSLITEKPSSVKADASITWISISPDHGDKAGDYTISITLTSNLTGDDRAAVITISCEGTEIAITVTQKAKTENGSTVQVIDSGVTGECAWTLIGFPGNYTLTISGNGAMGNYGWESPWQRYRDNIKTAVIQDGVTTIGDYAFYDCTGLTDVTIPNSVQAIGNGVCTGCSGLTTVTIPNSVTTIGEEVFAGCSGLTDMTIPNSVQTIGNGTFIGCTGLTDVTIGNSVQRIRNSSFGGCTGLTTVTIGNSVITIDDGTFFYCSSLTEINVNAANMQYSSENGVLFNKDRTTLMSYPRGKTGSYVISSSVQMIGNNAFVSCRSLTDVTIPNSVQTIGNGTFYDCHGLTDVTIPNSVQTIGHGAFYNCSGLTVVTIGNSVITIGDLAFSYCRGLTDIHVEAANTQYSSENGILFNKGKTTLMCYPMGKTGSYVIPNSVQTISNRAFDGCRGLTDVTIPNSIQTIDDLTFSNCIGLTSVIIPNSVQRIGEWVFSGCRGLTDVTIGSSVYTIGDMVFSSCIGLTVVTNLNPVPQDIGSGVFFYVNINDLTLKVPAGSVDDYKAAPVWSKFGNIVACE